MTLKYVAEGRLVGGRCVKCGGAFFPYSPVCIYCGGVAKAEDVPRRGVVLSYSVVHVSNGRFTTPYTVAIAKFGDFQLPGYVKEGPVNIGDEVVWEIGELEGGRWYYFKKL